MLLVSYKPNTRGTRTTVTQLGPRRELGTIHRTAKCSVFVPSVTRLTRTEMDAVSAWMCKVK